MPSWQDGIRPNPYFWGMTRFCCTLFMFVILPPCFAQRMVVLQGQTDSRYNNSMMVVKPFSSEITDTVWVKNGRFRFRVNLPQKDVLTLWSLYEEKTDGRGEPLGIFAEQTGTIHIDARNTSLKRAVVTGSAAQKVYEEFKRELNNIITEKGIKRDTFGDGIPLSNEAMALREPLDSLASGLACAMAAKYPKSLASGYILANFYTLRNWPCLEQTYYQLAPDIQQSFHGKRVREILDEFISAERNQTVHDFTLPDSSGNTISFNEIKNEVVLINFWASWCAPCREEFKLLRHVYEKYKQKGFTIISISVDASERDWKKALQKEQLPWPQLRDFDKVTSLAKRRFGVTGLPTTFLLNKKRTILYRDLRGGVLDKVVEGLVGNDE